MRMYTYIFDHPQWGMTVLFATVCQFIPVIGNIVLMGYQYEIVEQLHRGKTQYPEFNFDDFVKYLSRGIWPFLVALVMSLVLVPIFLIPMVGVVAVAGAFDSDEGITFAIIMVFMAVLGMVVMISMALFMMPLLLRAALTQQFSEGFKLGFAFDFISKMWLEIILGTLFLMVTYMGLITIGMLLCFVGIYPAVTLLFLAQAHLNYQLYGLYLRRGGEPIPLRDSTA